MRQVDRNPFRDPADHLPLRRLRTPRIIENKQVCNATTDSSVRNYLLTTYSSKVAIDYNFKVLLWIM